MHTDDEIENAPNYEIAAKYWSGIPATVDGMLVGFGFISDIDIRGSVKFLKSLFKLKDGPRKGRALDCGAGIGRITKYLLTKHFKVVDLVEQDKTFIEEAKKYIGSSSEVGNFYNTALLNLHSSKNGEIFRWRRPSSSVPPFLEECLQDFDPTDKYDVIWCQWVLGHLTDSDLVKFFRRCRNHLNPYGVIVVKENLSCDTVELDKEDSSVTRPYALMHKLFSDADLECICETKQKNFPKFLYRVNMFALKPKIIDRDIIL